METEMTDLQTLRSDGDNERSSSATSGCCNACASTLRLRNHRVTSHTFDEFADAALFHSSRERLIVQPDSFAVSTTTSHIIDLPSNDDFAVTDCSNCTNASCSCHMRGSVNPTFVSDNLTHIEDYTGKESTESDVGCHNHHVTAAQALMQPVNGADHHRRIFETSDKEQSRSNNDAPPLEMACYSVHRNGGNRRLVIEDLELSGCVVSSNDTPLTALNNDEDRHPPMLDVREAWPDKNAANVSTDGNRNNVTSQLSVCPTTCFVCQT